MKRSFDFIASLIGLLLFFPLLLAISIFIKTFSSGPIFFIQSRIGRNGDIFNMIKFRSMKMQQISKSSISLQGDERITVFGAFLRKYKLDELPELINVIKGDMSLVGPRPDVPGYADNLQGEERLILSLRPGITGPATLKYSNEEKILSVRQDYIDYNDNVIYPDKVRINLDYYYNHNLWIDIKIIFATIFRNNY